MTTKNTLKTNPFKVEPYTTDPHDYRLHVNVVSKDIKTLGDKWEYREYIAKQILKYYANRKNCISLQLNFNKVSYSDILTITSYIAPNFKGAVSVYKDNKFIACV